MLTVSRAFIWTLEHPLSAVDRHAILESFYWELFGWKEERLAAEHAGADSWACWSRPAIPARAGGGRRIRSLRLISQRNKHRQWRCTWDPSPPQKGLAIRLCYSYASSLSHDLEMALRTSWPMSETTLEQLCFLNTPCFHVVSSFSWHLTRFLFLRCHIKRYVFPARSSGSCVQSEWWFQ